MARFARIALCVVLVLWSPSASARYRYLLGRTAVPETSTYVIDLDELRRLAASIPGEPPLRVNHEQLTVSPLPHGAVFAGASLREPQPMSHGAYQIVYPDGYS